jgi:hypothetical protein
MLDNYGFDNDTLLFIKGILIASLVVGVIIYFIIAASYAKIFKKQGEKAVKGYIPIYNVCVLMKIVGMNPLAVLLLIIPIVNLFLLALLSVRVANKFSKSAGFALGLLFVPFICYPVLAFQGSSKKEKVEESIEESNENVKYEEIICKNCGTLLEEGTEKCFICDEPTSKDEIEIVKENIEKVKEDIEETVPFTIDRIEDISLGEVFEDSIDAETIPVEVLNDEITEEVEEVIDLSNDDVPVESDNQEEKIEETLETLTLEEESPKYKSSTKTLDEILKINNDFYASTFTKKEEELTLETADVIEDENIELEKVEEHIEADIEKEDVLDEEVTNNFEDIYKDLLKDFDKAINLENIEKEYVGPTENIGSFFPINKNEKEEKEDEILDISEPSYNEEKEVKKEKDEFTDIMSTMEENGMPNIAINNDSKEFVPLFETPEIPVVTEDLSENNSIDIETINRDYLNNIEENFEIQDRYAEDDSVTNVELEVFSNTATINVEDIIALAKKEYKVEDIEEEIHTNKKVSKEKDEFTLEPIELDKIEEI